MDKNKIKSFAIWARESLISSVKEKAREIGIYVENGEFKEIKAKKVQGGFVLEGIDNVYQLSYDNRKILLNKINNFEDKVEGFNQIIDEVAYTWFNRFIGLRYMEVNDYLPIGIRILSSKIKEKSEPDILSNISEVISVFQLNQEQIYKLLDTGKTQDREEVYKIILVKQCNELGEIIPQVFEKINDYTELLLPNNLLEEGSIIRRLVTDIDENDWKDTVEIIGWLYQFYVYKRKQEVDELVSNGGKVLKKDLPCKTQIFTPDWVVKYLVDNSIGAIWNETKRDSQIELKYYLDSGIKQNGFVDVERIKVIDPCMGSGHILSYAFDVLMKIYIEAGYSEREIPTLIINNNLYGLDIDNRAAQLAIFQLVMKARQYDRRFFRMISKKKVSMNIMHINESNSIINQVDELLNLLWRDGYSNEDKENLTKLLNIYKDAKEYGSLINVNLIDIKSISEKIEHYESNKEEDLYTMSYDNTSILLLKEIVKQSQILCEKYDCVITNPPYLGNGAMNENLQSYLNKNYKDTKSDLFAVFIMKGFELLKETGINAQVTMQSWMTLSSYNKFRKYIVNNKSISSLVHMGNGVMGIAFGTSATIFRNKRYDDIEAEFMRVEMSDLQNEVPKQFPIINEKYSKSNMKKFRNLPDNYIAYWISNKIEKVFEENKNISNYAKPRQGLATGDNEKFLRLWFEVDIDRIGFNFKNRDSAKDSNYKWFPCNKGGAYRKWYGNNDYVVNWENDGNEIRNFKSTSGKLRSRPQNMDFYFQSGITWSTLSSKALSMRYTPKGFLFETKGSMLFAENEMIIKNILGVMNSVVGDKLIQIVSPTMDFHEGPMGKVPMKICGTELSDLVNSCIEISKKDWDSYETSWDFKTHPLIKKEKNIESVIDSWKEECNNALLNLKCIEEKINKIVINSYDLEEELESSVNKSNLTIRNVNIESDIKSLISYAIGCMFGRYSIDCNGLIYAGGNFEEKWDIYNAKVKDIKNNRWIDSSFLPVKDNIILITDDEYFENDIVTKFIEFLEAVYGSENLEENIDIIASYLGVKNNETPKQAIRRYFLKEFYKEHLKVYKSGNSGSRPIYWMFESGKNDGFKCLIYMHRYNDQTVAKVRTDYLHTLQRKYEAEINRLKLVIDSEEYTVKQRTIAKKKIDKISKQIEECREYDQVVAYLANERKSINLDNGVKVNYAKFQGIKVINSNGKESKMNLLAKI